MVKPMRDFVQVEVQSRAQLRAWLNVNQAQTQSIWLVTFKKGKGPYVSYDEIVEEALCFGWIDSRPAKLDDARTMLLLSPRRKGSAWSNVNKVRVERLVKAGTLMQRGLTLIEQSKADGSWDRLNDVDALLEPMDLSEALETEPDARRNWDRFAPSSRRGILEWINNAKQVETRQARVQKTATLASQGIKANFPDGRNKQAGIGINRDGKS